MNLLENLKKQFPDSSRRTLQNWIKWGQVSVDGRIITQATLPISPSQKILVVKKERKIENIPILYEDRYLIIVNKPSGLLSVPAENSQPSVLSLLKSHLSLFPVHRIDQDSSGTLLFARSRLVQDKFDVLFESHSLEREYYAIVEGNLPQDSGIWECYLKEKENFDVEVASPEEGKRAITHFEVVRRSKNFTYLRLRLETGRKHQIRVQCREAGHPIVGDKRYGSQIKHRLCLHAYRIAFEHPFTGKTVSVSAPLPFKKFGSF